MAASSSSTTVASSCFKYKVFLSFRGADTRQGFTSNLYQSLQNARIETFMDEKDIEAGEKIDERLLKAIEDSRYCVVILSSGYADSKACLMELAAMFRLNKEIIPVFFNVEPSHVRHQSGPFKIAFSTHQKHPFKIFFSAHQKRPNSSRDVEEWRQAMTKVGQLKGFHLNHQSSKKEAEWIQEIVERVGGRSDNVMLPVAEHPVGINSRVEKVMELLSIGEVGVKMVGIYGMGGLGKTTLAKEIYNRLQGRFEKAIYIECIKDKKDRLPKLQEEFISKVFKDGNKKIFNTSEGSAEIKRRFPGKRVLAVLDDVDHGDQLKALAGGCDWFGEGTRILITTRDVHLLYVHRHVAKMYQVPELNSKESLRLFSRHAFNSDQPNEEFMEISTKIAKAAAGLPLALEVLGASLSSEREKEAWEEVETKLRSSGYSKIDKCLRISYAALNKNEKEGFLDIACFFLGQKKDEVIDIWKGCDFDAPVLIVNSLLQKCLLKVDGLGYLYMHDLLRDMGRVIGSHSRLWDQKKVWDVLEKHQGTKKIKGVICKKYVEGEGENVDVEMFTNMPNLQLLLLDKINLKGDFTRMPRSLRSLKWTGCSMQTLPNNFNNQKLGCLKLDSIKIVQFWSDSCISKEKVFTNLKVLDLSKCDKLKKLPDFSHSLDLEKLRLQGCSSLTDIPESIGNSTKLKMIDLIDCDALKSLPSSIGNLSELQRLRLSLCKSLPTLPKSIGKLPRLKRLMLDNCRSLSALPDSIGNLTELELLVLGGCTSLLTLLDSIENLTKLQKLDVGNCKSLSALPYSIGSLTLLEELQLNSCESLLSLPASIGNLTRLRRLDPSYCYSLSALPYSIGRLTLLDVLELSSCRSLSTLPDSIENLTGLRRLRLSSCDSLSALPYSIGRLTLLEELEVWSCNSLPTLPDSIENLTGLMRLDLSRCQSLSALPYSIGRLSTKLRELDMKLCTSLLTLPDSIGNLTGLEDLSLCSCFSLSTLPSSIGSMRRLSTLVLSGTDLEELPDSVFFLESLEWLGIARYRLRSRLPLWEMKCLKGLVIAGEDIESDDGDENEICEILDDITHYSQHTQECRRIRYLDTWEDYLYKLDGQVFELSIWVVRDRERKIFLVVYPLTERKMSCKCQEGRVFYFSNGPWLKHIFPGDFTPLHDTEALEACASSSSAPDLSKEQLVDFYSRISDLT